MKIPTFPTCPHHAFPKVGNRPVPTSPPPHHPIGVGSGGGAGLLLDLAKKVNRLSPHHRDPERFHEDKSEIERDLRRLARKVANG